MAAVTARAGGPGEAVQANLPFIIGASSVGTLIEWYDFYLYGVLAVFFSKHFFSPAMDPNLAFIASLAVFWTGFLVRPFGAIVFGHLGDLIGRKFTFMLTLLLMGAATFVVGLLPGYDTIGAAERKHGRGLAVTGGHPRGARVWHSRQTGWYLYVDGFEYRGAGRDETAVIDEMRVGVPDGTETDSPAISLSVKQASLFGTIHPGLRRSAVLARLKAKRISPKSDSDCLSWKERGFVRVNDWTAFRVWEVVLHFDKRQVLDEICVECE
jgi:hypothetical protein